MPTEYEVSPFLQALLKARSPSGYEFEAQQVFDRFVQPLPAATVWVLGSYYLAQGLIVHGMLQVLRVPQTK